MKKLFSSTTGIIAGFLFGWLWETATLPIGHLAYQNGYHYHHSLFAPLFLVISAFFIKRKPNKAIFLVGLAIGVFIQHILSDGPVFITREL